MKITKNGLFLEGVISLTAKPTICNFTDVDGARFNINTIALINMYEMLVEQLKSNNITIDEVKQRYTKNKKG